MTSFLHLWQASLSLTIFLGVWLGHYALASLRPWLEYVGGAFRLSDHDFTELIRDTLRRLRSPISFFFALPFILSGVCVAFFLADHAPSQIFPFAGKAPAFIYVVFVELCIFMLYLLGATGFWLLYVFSRASLKLTQLKSLDYRLVDYETAAPAANVVLRLCSFLFVIIASAMPGIAFVVFSFKGIPVIVLLGVVFGIAVPTLALTASFFGPTYFLHRLMVNAKMARSAEIKQQLSVCEDFLNRRITSLSQSKVPGFEPNDETLLTYVRFLREQLAETRARSVWPFKSSALLRLVGSSMLPTATFFAEQIIRQAFF
jgi:hypothetical protein